MSLVVDTGPTDAAANYVKFEPCPFCASEISVTPRGTHVGGFIGCCSSPKCPVGPVLIDQTEKALAQRWNTRGGVAI
ncbi:MAG: hypothetical protein Q7S99_03125 [Parvibaculum sp.]|nr:hypothetical protein [Parvibaculum sp.]